MRRLALPLLALVLALSLVGALLPDTLATATRPDQANLTPTLRFWLGTDHHGRDVALRLLMGTGNAVVPAVGACAVAGALGALGGTLAGWWGGWAGAGLRLLATTVATVPRYVLVLLVLTVWGNAPFWLAIGAGLAWAPSVFESVHQRVRRLVDSEYVLASRLHGIPDRQLLWRHLLWHGARRVVAFELMGLFAAFLVLEASLSYVGGLGIREPAPSLGNLLALQWGRGTWFDPRFWVPAIVLVSTIAASRSVARQLLEADRVR